MKQNPGYSTLIGFNCAVMGQGFGWDAIRRSFKTLVDSDDYDESDRITIMRQAENLSKTAEDYHFREKKRRSLMQNSLAVWETENHQRNVQYN